MLYPGNWPRNVARDAKYSVIHAAQEQMRIRLTYRPGPTERWLITTGSHPDLVDMVNAIKEEQGGYEGGAFYINEHCHVLVPVGNEYHYAGQYEDLLTFEFEGTTLSPVPPDDLSPGDDWVGPHVGIPYVLTANGRDVKYEVRVREGVTTERLLSAEVGAPSAAALARRLGRHKGQSGGRFYINEARHCFAPIPQPNGTNRHVYLGCLDKEDPWFATPDVPPVW